LEPRRDTTFLSLNVSPKTAMPEKPVMLVANLRDLSRTLPVPVICKPVTLAPGDDSCSASTDATATRAVGSILAAFD
jgi:hypothetical protein